MRYRFVLGASLVMAFCCSLLGQQNGVDRNIETPNETFDAAKSFKWFDSLGYPKLADRKLVHVTTGNWSQSGDDLPENSYAHAFLLREDGKHFTVLMLDLSERTFKKTPDGTPKHQRVDFVVADLKKMATDHLRDLRKIADEERDPWRRFGKRLGERSELFVLARACHAAGHEQVVKELIAQASIISVRVTDVSAPKISLQQGVAADIGHAQMWRAVLAFGDPDVSRKELLQQFRRITKLFPASHHAERAKRTADLLAKMVKEDDAHAEAKRKPLDKMTKKQRVAELIYQLRDQNGHQWSQPGSCDIFSDARKEKSPALQLAKMDFDAVPQLIEVIDDRRFTRSVGYHRDFYFSHHVLRVGDCALAIIERVAGRSFYGRTYTNAEAVKDGDAPTSKQQIQKWWAEVQEKGEKQVLVEATAKGDDNSPWQAQRLIKRYPRVAIEAIALGTRASTEIWTRTRLLQVAADIEGDRVSTFLAEELKKAPALSTRVAAASALMSRGKSASVAAMVGEWRQVADPKVAPAARPKSAPVVPPKDLPFGPPVDTREEGIDELIEFLATCGKPHAVLALAEGFERQSFSRRLSIVSALGTTDVNLSVSSFGRGGSLNVPRDITSPSRASGDAIELLLIKALEDTEEREGMTGSWGGKSFSDPRICDIAGHVLWMRWKDKYPFDLAANLKQRNEMRHRLTNIWRKEQGLKPLPPPKSTMVVPLPRSKIDPLLKRITSARSAAERKNAIASVEPLGLPALSAAHALAKDLPADHAAKKDLIMLTSRLANTISTVAFSPRSVVPDYDFRKRLENLQGKSLTTNQLVSTLVGVKRKLPAGASGIKLSADRYGDHSGVILTVTLVKQPVFQAGSQKDWATHMRVNAGNEALLGFASGYSIEEFARAVDQVLATSAEQPFVIRASLVKER